MPISTSPAVIMGDIQHTFHFDPTFKNVHLPSDCELRFFSQAFSLIDSMRGKDLFHSFVTRIKNNKGVLHCKEIIKVLRDEALIESTQNSEEDEEGLNFLLDNIYRIVNRIVMKKFVSCMQTSTLSCVAWEVGQLYMSLGKEVELNNNQVIVKNGDSKWEEKGEAWCELAQRFQDLAKYQHKDLKIHYDFQKSNYAPDPRSAYAYGTTALVIVVGFLYLLLKNVTRAEARELVRILNK